MIPRNGGRRAVRTCAAALLIAAATGCGISTTGPVRAGAPASGIPQPGSESSSVRIYFTDAYGVRAVTRTTDRPLDPQHALDLLLKGPTSAERDRGLTTQVPPTIDRLTATTTPGNIDLSIPDQATTGDFSFATISQIVCTAAHAQVPGDRPAAQVHVRIHGINLGPEEPWTVRCGPNDTATSVT
ncbi:GerMN domain-containing protein [Streptomyces anulatus]|uniref:GerMN domain-containing protein n=1 Tax=Streptomyces anulatus TaxID=1892 RepID=UPI00368FE7C4|nr:GerMN domain-containing protein [Streptomyces anulatus]